MVNSTDSASGHRNEGLESIIAAYINACDAGDHPDQNAILERHHEYAEELREFFVQRDRMNLLTEPIRDFVNDLFQTIGPGQQISYVGNYELLEEIARGGMGAVYKARQKNLGRIVAVKMILAGRFANEEGVKRFQIEAEAAANLQHPNIVPIHEVGQHDGLHYYSMDFVEGRSLSTILHENPLPPKQAATYVRQMAEAIHFAHQQGTLHRDLKPSNLLIDDRDQVRITDFGLALRADEDSVLTQTGQIVGTPSYMPPEQAEGNRNLIGPRSDVYSLGAILYECLTGRAPFRAESVVKTIEQVLHIEAASPRLLNPEVDTDLETICLKCLEKEPNRRYRTAKELADDLQSYLNNLPILARPVGQIERSWRFCKRNPTITALICSAAVVVVLGAGLVTRGFYNEQLKSANLLLEQTLGERDAALSLAGEQKQEADHQREIAVEAERRTRQFMYSAHVLLASKAVDAADPKRAYELLAPFRDDDSTVRGPEWEILWRKINGDQFSLKTIPGTRADIRCIQYHPDDAQIVTGSVDGTVTVWSVGENKPRYFIRHTSPIERVCFLHRGSGIIFLDNTRSIYYYGPDAATSQHLGKFNDEVTSLHAWPRDGVFASCLLDGTVRTAKTTKSQGKLVSETTPSDGICVAINNIGRLHLWRDSEQPYSAFVKAYEAPGGKSNPWRDGEHQPTQFIDLKVTPAAPYLATSSKIAVVSERIGDRHWQLVVVDVNEAKEIGRIEILDRDLLCFAVSPDGRWIGVGGTRKTRDGDIPVLQIYQVDRMSLYTDRESGPGTKVDSLAFRGDSTQLVGSIDGSISFWQIPDLRDIHSDGPSPRATLTFSPDGNKLATIHPSGKRTQIVLRNGSTGTPLETLEFQTHNVFDVTFDPSGQLVAAAGHDGVQTWSAQTGEKQRFFASKHQCFRVKLDPKGDYIAGAGGGTTVWNRSTGEVVYQNLINWKGGLTESANWHTGLAFSPDGRLLAVAKRYGEVSLLDTQKWEKKCSFISDFWVLSLTFSPDGAALVGCGHDPNLWFWNPIDGKVIKTLHTTAIKVIDDVLFSEDGQRFVLGHGESTASIWDATSDTQLLYLGTPQTRGGFCTVAMPRNGKRLATNTGIITLW